MSPEQRRKAIIWLETFSTQAKYDSQEDIYTITLNGIAMASLRAFLEEIAPTELI